MLVLARWTVFAVGSAALLAAGARLSRLVTAELALRLLSTATLTATFAVGESLVLGRVGHGASSGGLIAAALVTLGACLLATERWPPTAPSMKRLIVDRWVSSSPTGIAALGAVTGVIGVWTAYMVWRPVIGGDGLTYHLAEPAMWVADGRPGSMHTTIVGLPVQGYPKTGEVLFYWAAELARTPLIVPFVMVPMFLVLGASLWTVLRRLEVAPRVAAALVAATALCPLVFVQVAAADTDLLTLCWVVVTGALCLAIRSDSRLICVALLAGGLAIGTKTTAVPVVVVLLATTIWSVRQEIRNRVPLFVLSLAVALAIGAVWYVQDLVVYQAPLYPFSSFPAGPPVPAVISKLGASFLHNPGAALRVAGARNYLTVVTADGIFLLFTPILALLIPFIHGRRRRIELATAASAALLEALLWSVAPFTGWSGVRGTESLVVGGVRYLLPGSALFVVVAGLASRSDRLVGWVARAIIVLALAVDVGAFRHFGAPTRPGLPVLVLAMLAGAVVGLIAAGIRVPNGDSPWLLRGAVAGLVVVGVVVMTLATPGFLQRHLVVARGGGLDQPGVLAWLSTQPECRTAACLWQSARSPTRSTPARASIIRFRWWTVAPAALTFVPTPVTAG